tara:strand:- start:2354 stop:3550 length:1197 start_codon:yes stop_codon:yes gene_type:complete
MATFQAQVEGLTGLTIGSSPTVDELSQFLKDGVLEITNKCIKINPSEIQDFQRVSSTIDSNGGIDLGGAKIITVLREANSDGSNDGTAFWKSCRKISPEMESDVVDTTSLKFATIYNPVYLISDNNKINVYPVPSSNNGYKIYYVNNDPQDETNETTLTSGHSDIKWFPSDKVYLVVLYAAIYSLQNAMASKLLPEDIGLPSLPSPLSLTDIPIIPNLNSNSISFSTTAPTYSGPTVVPNFGDAENWINIEEDPEMLAGRIQTINSQINEFSAKVQNSVQSFNKENVEYQAQLQISIQNAQLSQSDDSQKLQKYASEISIYQNDNSSRIGKFNADLQSYSSEISSKLQDYSAKIQKAVTDYGWMDSRLKILISQYEGEFALMVAMKPQPMQASQQARR